MRYEISLLHQQSLLNKLYTMNVKSVCSENEKKNKQQAEKEKQKK